MAKRPDWEAIENAYRAGSLSIRSIAEKHSVSEGGIRKRASKEGWARDLTDRVKSATKAKLSREADRTKGTQYAESGTQSVRTDDDIVEEAATEAASVVLAHRVGLAQWRGIADKLLYALQDMDVTEDNHGNYARSLNSGVDAQLKIIKGERQAYNMDTEEGDKTVTDLASMMDDLSGEA